MLAQLQEKIGRAKSSTAEKAQRGLMEWKAAHRRRPAKSHRKTAARVQLRQQRR
jgi:hypothetical protein